MPQNSCTATKRNDVSVKEGCRLGWGGCVHYMCLFISLLHVGYVAICFGVTQYSAVFQHSYERV